jgi:ATP-dependent protease ClpP protease subunit
MPYPLKPSPEPAGDSLQYTSVTSTTFRTISIQVLDLSDEVYIESLIMELRLLDIGTDDKLEIYISCYGGTLDLTLHLINTIALLVDSNNITTIITSHAYSAATLLFMLGSTRYVFEESSLMLHTYSGGSVGKSGEMLSDIEFNLKRFDKLLLKYYGRYLTEEEHASIKHGKDLYFDADELLKRGIATNLFKLEFYQPEEDKPEQEEESV